MVMPMFINGLGNILIIICIGNSDVSYPRCNNISVIIYIITYEFIISSILMEYNNGVGWTIYPPLASIYITISSIEIYSIIHNGVIKYIVYTSNKMIGYMLIIIIKV
jgi:heme/copper-type cytochrome/quinol oxidase subunit 1